MADIDLGLSTISVTSSSTAYLGTPAPMSGTIAGKNTTSGTVRFIMYGSRGEPGFQGVDISSYQTINDPALFFSSIDYAYFRAYGSDHSKTGDTSFENFVALAKQYNVPSGAYYFGTPRASDSIISEAEQEAQQFIEKLEGAYSMGYGDLMPMLDIEEYKDLRTGITGYPMASGMTADQLIQWIFAFRDYFYNHTKRSIGLYVNRYFIEDQMGFTPAQLEELSAMPLWLAEYDRWYPWNVGSAPEVWGGWTKYNLWQYEVTDDASSIGISSNGNEIDRDFTPDLNSIMPPPPPSNITITQTSNVSIRIDFTEPTAPDYIGNDIYVNGDLVASLPIGVTSHEMLVSTPLGRQLQVNVVTKDSWGDTGWSENVYLTMEDQNPPPPPSDLPVKRTSLYIFNREETLVAVLDQHDKNTATFYDGKIKQVLNGEHILSFTVPVNHPDADLIEELGYVAVKNKYEQWNLFEITEIVDVHSGIGVEREVTAEGAFVELDNVIIENLFHDRKKAGVVLPTLLANTRWDVGIVDIPDSEIHDLTVKRESVLSALQTFRERWGGELIYRIEIIGNRISKRIIDFVQTKGAWKGKRFEYSESITEITRTIEARGVKTAVYAYGPEIENSGGLRMDIRDIVWSKANGDPVDKPAGQAWVGDPDAKEIWGKPLNSETTDKQHLFGVYENNDALDPMDLIWKAWVYGVQVLKNPTVSYSAKVIDLYQLYGRDTESVDLGDTVAVLDTDLNLTLSARVVEYTMDLDYPEKDALTLGNYLPTFTSDSALADEVSSNVISRLENSTFLQEGDTIQPSWLETEFEFAQDAIRLGGGTVIMNYDDGILIVDDPDNPQKAIKLSAGQIALANSRDIATNTFNWRNFGTGEGWLSDLVETGFLKFDRSQGGTLTLGGAENGNGQLIVYDEDGNVIGDLDASKGGFTTLFVGHLTANNVLNSNSSPIAFVVNPNGDDSNDGLTTATAFRTIGKAIASIPKHNNSTCDIWIADGVYNETVYIQGFFGSGSINVYFQGAQMNGRLIVSQNNQRITLSSGYVYQGYGSTATREGTLLVEGTSYCLLTGMEVQSARRVDYGLKVKQSMVAITGTCKFYDATTAQINADVGGMIDIMANCQGSGGYAGIEANGTGRIAMHNITTPAGTSVIQAVYNGGTIVGTRSDTAAGVPAVLETPPITTYFSPTTKSWNSRNGWATENNYIYQGEWSTVDNNGNRTYWGNWKGCFFFDNTAINNALVNRTIVSARITLKRLTYGGYSGGYKARLWTLSSNSSVIGKSEPVVDYEVSQSHVYGWGETESISIPNWIITALTNGSYGGFALYWPDGTNYMIFSEDVTLEITYK